MQGSLTQFHLESGEFMNKFSSPFPRVCSACLATGAQALLITLFTAHHALAYVVGITPGSQSLYLQVGTGTITGGGGRFSSGGTPANNGTVNRVSITVPAANLGDGTRPMTTNSSVTTSSYDGFTFCSVPTQVYVGGFYRTPGAAANATLTVRSPATLVNAAGDSIAFNRISWVSGGNGDPVGTIPSGVFTAGTTQALLNVTSNTWFESCLAFNYANSELVPAGTFNGQVRYTLSLP